MAELARALPAPPSTNMTKPQRMECVGNSTIFEGRRIACDPVKRIDLPH